LAKEHEEPEEPERNVSQNIERIRSILSRRRWLIAGTASAVLFGTLLVLLHLPNRYTSEATLLVVGQQVPERYVIPTTTSDVSQALSGMMQEVLSRPGLRTMIDEMDLYPDEKMRLAPEQVVDLMRRDVSIKPLVDSPGIKDLNAFKISFIANNPQLAQRVTSRLTTVFIEQNLKRRAKHATTTTSFLHEQLESAKRTLTEQEQRLRDYKMQFLGELPEQQQGNLGILAGLQAQLENVMAGRNRAQQQRLYLESVLSGYRRTSMPGTGNPNQSDTPLEAARRELDRMQAENRSLLKRYNPLYPDVRQKQREIAGQQAFIESLRRNSAAVPAEQQATRDSAQVPQDSVVMAQLKSQLDANTFEIESLEKQEQRLRTEVDQYQSRLNMTPVREQQLTSIQRDYDLVRQHYGDLLKKEQESQLATSLEKQQEGQQFRVADPATLPTLPSSPKRLKVSLGSIVTGLFLGCALAFGAEAKDTSFRSESDVRQRLALSLVIGIPMILTKAERRSGVWKNICEWSAVTVLILIASAAELFLYRNG
jgi:succinoglycan biosynthesis transport protein ExoP